MKIVSLDVHTDASQGVVVTEAGEVVFEAKIATEREAMRAFVSGVAGPKRVVFEEGPLSARLYDWLADVCDEIVSCDPTHNALIARAEDSNDERDARRLATLAQLNAIKPVYIPPEPYRTLRSVLNHDYQAQRRITMAKNRIRGLCRRHGVRGGRAAYSKGARAQVIEAMPNAVLKWQMQSLYGELDVLRRERVGARRVATQWCKKPPIAGIIPLLVTIPGIGPITARTLVAWIADPRRFPNRAKIGSYSGLGLGQGVTDWKPVGRTHASKRGNRQLKRVLFLAAHAASRSHSAFGRLYQARLAAGWPESKANRDLARTILQTAWALWKKGKPYDDCLVAVPEISR